MSTTEDQDQSRAPVIVAQLIYVVIGLFIVNGKFRRRGRRY